MKPILRLLLAAAAVMATAAPFVSAKKLNTRPKGKLQAEIAVDDGSAIFEAFDTIPNPDFLRVSGYDKSLQSTHETLHLTNASKELTVVEVTLDIEYLDRQGREIHRREVTIATDVPPEATRRLKFKSWDVQKSTYYIGGKKPRTSGVTPYDVRISVVKALARGQAQWIEP